MGTAAPTRAGAPSRPRGSSPRTEPRNLDGAPDRAMLVEGLVEGCLGRGEPASFDLGHPITSTGSRERHGLEESQDDKHHPCQIPNRSPTVASRNPGSWLAQDLRSAMQGSPHPRKIPHRTSDASRPSALRSSAREFRVGSHEHHALRRARRCTRKAPHSAAPRAPARSNGGAGHRPAVLTRGRCRTQRSSSGMGLAGPAPTWVGGSG